MTRELLFLLVGFYAGGAFIAAAFWMLVVCGFALAVQVPSGTPLRKDRAVSGNQTLFAADPFASLGPCPWKPDDGCRDWTEQAEQTLSTNLERWGHLPLCAHDRWEKKKLAAYRAGKEMSLKTYGETVLTLADGTRVAVVWDPHWLTARDPIAHIEFHGEITETGYRSVMLHGPHERPQREADLLPFLIDLAEKLRAETIADWTKEQQRAKRVRKSRRAA